MWLKHLVNVMAERLVLKNGIPESSFKMPNHLAVTSDRQVVPQGVNLQLSLVQLVKNEVLMNTAEDALLNHHLAQSMKTPPKDQSSQCGPITISIQWSQRSSTIPFCSFPGCKVVEILSIWHATMTFSLQRHRRQHASRREAWKSHAGYAARAG